MEPRQRGNAVQLLEKYNNLAREAQQQGERVQAEYYMQYADHYHRVVAEMRARQDERQGGQQNGQQQGERPRGQDRDDRERGDRYERDRDDRDDDRYAGDDRNNDDDMRDDDEDRAPVRTAPRAPRGDDRGNRAAPVNDRRPEPRTARADAEVDDDDVGGAMRTLARSPRAAHADDGEAGEVDALNGAAAETAPRRRGRPRRQPRPEANDTEREPVDA